MIEQSIENKKERTTPGESRQLRSCGLVQKRELVYDNNETRCELKFLQGSLPDASSTVCKIAKKAHARIQHRIIESQGFVNATVSQEIIDKGFLIVKSTIGNQIRSYARHSYILQLDDEIVRQLSIKTNATRLGFFVLERGIFVQPYTRQIFVF